MTALHDDTRLTGGLSDIEYHRLPSLSASRAKLLLDPSCPAKFREEVDNPPPPKADYDFGHVAHKLVLGEGSQVFVLDPDVHGLKADGTPSEKPAATAMWKAAVAEARASDQVPIHIDEYRRGETMAAVVKAHRKAGPLFVHGHAEKSLFWTDEETGVHLRARPDWITLHDFGDGLGERVVIVDYKTAVSANDTVWCRTAADYGYHIQFAWYCTGYHAVMGVMPVFLFVVQEKKPPYVTTVIELDAAAYRLGLSDMREAIRVFRDCTDSGIWPGYADNEIRVGSLPPWKFPSSPTIADLIETA